MANLDKMAKSANELFCTYDQDALLARYPLRHDDAFIFINFLGHECCVDRVSGTVSRAGSPVSARETLIVLDMLCNNVGAPVATGTWCTMAEASQASSSPSASGLFDEMVARLEGKREDIAAACATMGARPVPGGEVSVLFDVFDSLPVWMQYWDADDEFGVNVSFLWDKSVRLYLHFETMWYVLYEILDRILAQV